MQSRRSIKSLLINPDFQITVIAYTLLVSATVTGAIYGANWYLASTFVERGKTLGLPPDHVYFQFLVQQQQLMFEVVLGAVAFSFLVIALGGIILSHRVAGPLKRLNDHMIKLANGEALEMFNFRDRDFFPELAKSFNGVVQRFKSK